MSAEPFDWNVVVVGFWNPAILTPAGIAHRLFCLEPGTPIAVEVPLDGLAPSRVKNENITVTLEPRRLMVLADLPKYDLLERALRIAAKAIDDLPETPIIAAGFNVRFKIANPPIELMKKSAVGLDDSLSQLGFVIVSRGLRRTLKHENGVINLEVQIDSDEDMKVTLNFHLESQDKNALRQWLSRPIADVKKTVSDTFQSVFSVRTCEGEE